MTYRSHSHLDCPSLLCLCTPCSHRYGGGSVMCVIFEDMLVMFYWRCIINLFDKGSKGVKWCILHSAVWLGSFNNGKPVCCACPGTLNYVQEKWVAYRYWNSSRWFVPVSQDSVVTKTSQFLNILTPSVDSPSTCECKPLYHTYV